MSNRYRTQSRNSLNSCLWSFTSRSIRVHRGARRGGFTLVELLVVIFIILLISAIALPTVLPALAHRQVSEGARILQSALVGARDDAVRNNGPSGIRLLPDPTFSGINATTGMLDYRLPLAYNRIVPVGPAHDYSEGRINIIPRINPVDHFFSGMAPIAYPVPDANGSTRPYPYDGLVPPILPNFAPNVLMVEESIIGTAGPNSPTSWFWNIRVGDKIQINSAGPWYTVVGPMAVTQSSGNPELFVNVGPPGTVSPLNTPLGNPEFLFLVNGRDDNGNGWPDEGWDGVNNNLFQEQNNAPPLQPLTDEIAEWEGEVWLGSIAASVANGNVLLNQLYTIERRPVPQISAREVSLPSGVVIDATSWGLSSVERTRVPGSAFNMFTGVIEFLVNPDGSIVPTTLYSSPTSLGMDGSFFHFWLAERSDVHGLRTDSTGNPLPLVPNYPFYLPMPLGANLVAGGTNAYDTLVASNPALPVIKGESRIVTIFTRTGQISTNDNPVFDVSSVNQPFLEARHGVSGGSQ